MTSDVALIDQTLVKLAEWEAPLVVSAFMPIDRTRPNPSEPLAQIARRLAQLASSELTAKYGLAQSATELMLAPMVTEALDDVPLTARGLAVYMSSDEWIRLPMPTAIGPAVAVGHHPDLLRLLPAVVDDVAYFALSIGKHGAQLFRGSRFEFAVEPVPDMPGSIDDALWYVRREPIRTRTGSGVLHGSGGGEDLRKDDLRRYLHLVDKAITPVLNGHDAPLVVIGVEYEAAMFINHTHYRHVVDVPIATSPEAMSAEELHRRSWESVCRTGGADRALARLRELAGTGRTVTDAGDVVASSRDGLVDELLVAQWATVDVVGVGAPGDEDRTAAVKAVNWCLRKHSTIHVVDGDALGATVAAILRY